MLLQTVRSVSLLFVLVLTGSIWASPGPAALARVESVTLRTTGRDFLLADVGLRNISAQTITAYTVSVKATYSTGKILSRSVTNDSVFALLFGRLGMAAPPNTRFDSNSLSTESVALPTDPNGALPTATATVEMVALADKTIYGPPEAAALLQRKRKAESDDNGDVVSTLAQLQDAQDPGSELTRLIGAKRAVLPSDDGRRRVEEARIARVERTLKPVIATTTDLSLITRIYKERQAVLLEHSSLRQPTNKGELNK